VFDEKNPNWFLVSYGLPVIKAPGKSQIAESKNEGHFTKVCCLLTTNAHSISSSERQLQVL